MTVLFAFRMQFSRRLESLQKLAPSLLAVYSKYAALIIFMYKLLFMYELSLTTLTVR